MIAIVGRRSKHGLRDRGIEGLRQKGSGFRMWARFATGGSRSIGRSVGRNVGRNVGPPSPTDPPALPAGAPSHSRSGGLGDAREARLTSRRLTSRSVGPPSPTAGRRRKTPLAFGLRRACSVRARSRTRLGKSAFRRSTAGAEPGRYACGLCRLLRRTAIGRRRMGALCRGRAASDRAAGRS